MIVTLNEKDVKKLFDDNENVVDVALGLYKMIYPDWDKIKQVKGFPQVNEATNLKLFSYFNRYKGVSASLLWMNKGFGSVDAKDLQDWEVMQAEVEYESIS